MKLLPPRMGLLNFFTKVGVTLEWGGVAG